MKPKKSLGQNFLTSQSVVNKIIEKANLNANDVVLEAGPGKGILTQALIGIAGKVVAVEKDDELISALKEKFEEEIKNKKLILVHGDILNFDFERYGLKNANYKIVANIPYYISGEFLRKSLSSDIQPSRMVLLVQKEVAERIARSKKESILSISVKAYGEPKYIQTVKRGSFAPAPKVDSAILLIDNISKSFFSKDRSKGRPCLDFEKRFFEVVKAGFAHKRKFLISNLEKVRRATSEKIGRATSELSSELLKEKLKRAFIKAKIEEKARAEDISLEQWRQLAREKVWH